MNCLAKKISSSDKLTKTTIITFLYLTSIKLEIHIMGDENWAIHSFNKHLNLHIRDCLFHIQIFYNHLSLEELLPEGNQKLLFSMFKTRPDTIKTFISLFGSLKGINFLLINLITYQIHFANM